MRSLLALLLLFTLTGCPSALPPPCRPPSIDAAGAKKSVLASPAFEPLKGLTVRSAELESCKRGTSEVATVSVKFASLASASTLGIAYAGSIDYQVHDATGEVLEQGAYRKFGERAVSIIAAATRVEQNPEIAAWMTHYGKPEAKIDDPGEPLPWCVEFTAPSKTGGIGGALKYCDRADMGITEYSVERLEDAPRPFASGLVEGIAAAHPGCATASVRFYRSNRGYGEAPWFASGELTGAGCAPSFRANHAGKGPWHVDPR